MRLPTATAAFATHATFSDLASRYDGFILDQYGVLHDGRRALPGAAECVSALSAMGKRLIILSNTSSPADAAVNKLPKLGFDPTHFLGAVTSGEEASRYVRETRGAGGGGEPQRALWLTWSTDNADVSAHPLTFLGRCGDVVPASSVEEADFVLAHGSQVVRGPGGDGEASVSPLGTFKEDGDPSGAVDPLLRRCLERGLPLVCANPDLVVKLSDGRLAHMPGAIARRYEEMGGDAVHFGKPHAAHFEACLRELGLDRSRVAHVGDSLRHDVAGADAAGIDSVFVTGGVHLEALGGALGEVPEERALRELFESEGVVPKYVVPMFRM